MNIVFHLQINSAHNPQTLNLKKSKKTKRNEEHDLKTIHIGQRSRSRRDHLNCGIPTAVKDLASFHALDRRHRLLHSLKLSFSNRSERRTRMEKAMKHHYLQKPESGITAVGLIDVIFESVGEIRTLYFHFQK